MRTAIATKFVAWEVPSLENLQGSKVYGLRTKLNNGEKLSREEKDWLTRNVNSNTYFKSAVPLQGWMFDFSDILRTYIVSSMDIGRNTRLPTRPHSAVSYTAG